MTLKDLATGHDLPNWLQPVVWSIALVAAALPVWNQVDATFALTDRTYEEWQKHYNETPIVFAHTDPESGAFSAKFYPSDNCWLLCAPGRQCQWMPITHFSFDELAEDETGLFAVLAAEAQPGCLNPHPGPFRTWLGDQRRGAAGYLWVQVFREFSDSCTHYQWRREDGVWDIAPSGEPRVTWVRCIH